MDAHVGKPIQVAGLVEAMAQALARTGAGRAAA
jgi:hypothetical protein